jgi:hypothetical protein
MSEGEGEDEREKGGCGSAGFNGDVEFRKDDGEARGLEFRSFIG